MQTNPPKQTIKVTVGAIIVSTILLYTPLSSAGVLDPD